MLTFFFFPAHSKILDTLGWHPSDFKLRSAHSEMAILLLQGLSTVYQIKMIGYPLLKTSLLYTKSKSRLKTQSQTKNSHANWTKSCTYILVQTRTKKLSNRASLTSTFNGISSLASLNTQDHKTIILIGHKPSTDKTWNVNLHNPLYHIIDICLSIKASVFKKQYSSTFCNFLAVKFSLVDCNYLTIALEIMHLKVCIQSNASCIPRCCSVS